MQQTEAQCVNKGEFLQNLAETQIQREKPEETTSMTDTRCEAMLQRQHRP